MVGTIQGSTKAALGQKPGEKVLMTYVGALYEGKSIKTYLSSFDTYQVQPLEPATIAGAGNSPYIAHVYQTNLSNYGQIYFHVYQAGNGPIAAADAPKCSVLIMGER